MSRSQRHIDPSLIEMDVEQNYILSTGSKTRRVKLERGQSALVRFLPARLGPKKLFYARIAKHWVNNRAIICPKNTSPDYGGDPDAYCDVCEEAKNLNENADEKISKFGYRSMANAQWLTYCLMFEKSTGQGPVALPEKEQLIPWEFDHYKTSYEELSNFYRNNLREGNRSVLDYLTGCDFWANKTSKGIRLDKQDPRPIFDGLTKENVGTDETIKKIEEMLKTPKVIIPTEAELRVFADKLHDAGYKEASAGTSRSVRGFTEVEEPQAEAEPETEAEPQPRPRSSTRAVPPAQVRATRSVPPPEEDQVPGAEMPAEGEAAPEEAADVVEEPVTEGEIVEEVSEPVEELPAEIEPVEEEPAPPPPVKAPPARSAAPVARSAPAAPARSAAPATVTRIATPATRSASPAPPTRAAAPVAAPVKSPAGVARPPARQAPAPLPKTSVASAKSEKIDEEEPLPEEATDQAPPADAPLGANGQEEAPPAVTRSGNPASRKIAESIASVTRRTAR